MSYICKIHGSFCDGSSANVVCASCVVESIEKLELEIKQLQAEKKEIFKIIKGDIHLDMPKELMERLKALEDK